MFNISSLKSNTNFDGFMVKSIDDPAPVTAVIELITGEGAHLVYCELCSETANRLYLLRGVGGADDIVECQSCLYEQVQCADMTGDTYFAPLSH